MMEVMCKCGHPISEHASREAMEVYGDFGCNVMPCDCQHSQEDAAELAALRAELAEKDKVLAKLTDWRGNRILTIGTAQAMAASILAKFAPVERRDTEG